LNPGDLFVALRGERFDGHDFVKAALAAGASGAVVTETWWATSAARSEDESAPVYRVDDTLRALASLAREVRRVSRAQVFAVTGSVGKTSTKDTLKAMLGRLGSVVATKGNQNNEVGVPLTLLGVGAETQSVVVEMGMRGVGQIADLAAVAEPDVGVITNVYPVHLELLGSIEQVAAAKAELLAGVRSGGAVVVPRASGLLEPYVQGCQRRVIRFGSDRGEREDAVESTKVRLAQVTGRLERADEGRYGWTVRWPDGEAYLSVGYMSAHAHENALAAAAACYAAGLPMEACLEGIHDLELSQGRGQTVEVGGICVIDDSYNANPAAVESAVDDLVRMAQDRGGRAVAVLGDMLELGPGSEAFHERVGEMAAAAGVSVLWGVGPLSEATVKGFRQWCEEHREEGVDRPAEHAVDADDVARLIEALRTGDVVLVKGSRGVALEKVVIRVRGEGEAGRWSGGAAFVEVDSDVTGETRNC